MNDGTPFASSNSAAYSPVRQPVRFEIVDVSTWQETHEEAMGTKEKVWLASPSGEDWLFKRVRGESEQAEDWSEKIAAELAQVLGVPAARVELAERNGERGIISRSITHGRDLVHGNELLFGRDPTYEKDKQRPERGYNLAAVKDALEGCSPPIEWQLRGWSAFDVFVGYLVFDALIANQDRHHENWAALVDRTTGERSLAASFDHASSLGFMLTDAERRDRLATRDRGRSVSHWAGRGRSRHFEGRPHLATLAVGAMRMCAEWASDWWIERLRSLGPADWNPILGKIPDERMSDVACTFANEIMTINRGRLLNACSDLRASDSRSV